jgi:outer membrane protein OmpA-like peptidoglycan-associated protein
MPCRVVVALVGVICFSLTNAAGMTGEAMDAYLQAHRADEFTTQDVIRLVELKVDSDLLVKEIAQRVSKNVDLTFSASETEIDQLKKAGASNDLIEALRSPISAVRFAREHPSVLPRPVQFTSEEGDYSVDYPDQPEKKDWGVGNDHGSLYIAVLANVIYMSGYSVYNQDVDADRELEANTTSFAKEIHAKVTEKKRTRFVRAPGDELPALECTVESDKALGRCLSVVDGRRFYIVSGLSVKPQNGEAAIDLFLKSFKLASSAAGAPSMTPQPTAQTSASTPQDQTPADREPSLVSLSAGAFPVKKPTEAYGSSVLELMDELPVSHWRSASGVTDPQVFVMELPDKTVLKTVEFDCAYDLFEHEGVCAKDVSVEISDKGEADGYQKIAEASLKEGADNQKFPVSSEIPGRWVRLTVKNNHGSKEFIQLNDFRARGTQSTHTPLPNISGTYATGTWGDLHLKQEGTSVTGCYTYLGRSDNLVEGGIEGRVVKINYCTYCSEPGRSRGPAFLVFSADGKRFIGLYWYENSSLNAYGGLHLEGTKTSSEVGTCPQWAGAAKNASAVENQLTKDLEEFGRARVYGINFDSDSDHIKDESKPTLDKIASMLKAKSDWKMTIEGHTDSTSTPQHNQGLSERRAASVKNYLTTAGINGARLTPVGYGQSKPVADNASPLGRAQNRRVELTKQ